MALTKTPYKGWPNCYRLYNDQIELIVTTDVGPRVIRFGFIGGDNLFAEFENDLGQTGGDTWRLYGGHRLWHAPEQNPRSYFPDNGPVALEEHPGFVRLVQPVEATTGIQKEIDIALAPATAQVTLTHRLRNTNLWTVELAPWALTVMGINGVAVIPLPPRGSHETNLLPTNSLTLWAYTDMTDPRWTWGRSAILLRQDPQAKTPQKIGVLAPDGWIAFARGGDLFVKRFHYLPGASYPDFGCTVEIFTRSDMLEVETLGPLVQLAPAASVEHVEQWHLFRDVAAPQNDADVTSRVLPKVAQTLG